MHWLVNKSVFPSVWFAIQSASQYYQLQIAQQPTKGLFACPQIMVQEQHGESTLCTTKIGVISNKLPQSSLFQTIQVVKKWPFTLLPLDHKIDYIIVGETNKTNSNVKWNRNRTKSLISVSPSAQQPTKAGQCFHLTY